MDPMVGSVVSNFDIIGSNSNSTGCLINLCSLCNLQFTDNLNGQSNETKVEKILDVFLSDHDENEQVQLCSNCKLLCANLICAKQSLLVLIDKITTLIMQNSRFTLVNPQYKIIPKLFQFRLTKTTTTAEPSVSAPAFTNCNQKNSNQSPAPIENNQQHHHDSVVTKHSAAHTLANSGAHNPIQIKSSQHQQVGNISHNNLRLADEVPGELTDATPICAILNTEHESPSFHLKLHTIDRSSILNEKLEVQDGNIVPLLNNLRTLRIIQGSQTKSSSPVDDLHECGLGRKETYRQRKDLKARVRVKKEGAKFQCDLCIKTFTQKCGLQRHMRIHTGERAFHCPQCDKTFKHHTTFSVHKLTHTGKRQFTCPSCELAFFSTSHLRRHQKSHTGDKPYSCRICGRTFSEKYNLDSHIRTHTGESAYKCPHPHCSEGFARKPKLTLHVKQNHLSDALDNS